MSPAFKKFFFALLGGLLLIHVRGQPGYISIDCGGTHISSYNDETTGLTFIPDIDFIDTGETHMVSTEYRNILQQPYDSLRSFPKGTRNCYRLNLTRNSKFLVRATFYYGNYDGKNKLPEFELHLGPNLWQSVTFQDASTLLNYELIHVPLRDYIHVCLVNTGSGVPFISSIETRLFPSSIFKEELVDEQSLALVARFDTGQTKLRGYRFPFDTLDRFWSGYVDWADWTQLNASSDVDTSAGSYNIPPIVMNTAATPTKETDSFINIWQPESDDDTSLYFIYLHFAEVEKLQPNQSRMFDIILSGGDFASYSPVYGMSEIYYSPDPLTRNEINVSVVKMENSTLPPILNAFEVYMITKLSGSETNEKDLNTITNIKKTYKVEKNWQGDPCAPQKYSWDGLNCTYPENNETSRIISLDLSSSALTEEITPWISDLAMLQKLNLSNNNLTGSIPVFLSQLQNLRVLDLSNNNLTGSIPDVLSRLPNLNVLFCNNPNLSGASSCEEKKNDDNNNRPNFFLFIGLPIIGVASIIFLIVAAIWASKRKSKDGAVVGAQPRNGSVELELTRRQFTYSDILKITNNRQRTIGKGGFGDVYHGYIDGHTQVAVKLLSPSSSRGLEQFHAEVNLLMRVHHTNLTSLVGYCDDEHNKGLVYEYMPRGNLQEYLSDKSSNVLTWEGRLLIATDAAQGLEYLHYGCKPPIIHRDVKTTNILLSENFQAKLSDFGLSRNFPAGDGTHIVTGVAGTPGYLAPEYKQLNKFNEKSDVYSFGIVLLEIITGRPAVSRTRERIPIDEWIGSIIPNGDIDAIVDPRLKGIFDVSSAWKVLEMAMACVSPEANRRPTMSKVVGELKQCLETQLSRRNQNRYGTEPVNNAFDIVSQDGYSITMMCPSVR